MLPVPNDISPNPTQKQRATILTGENADAFTFGLNDDAFTFSLFCAVGESGLGAGFAAPFVAADATGCSGVGATAVEARLPLNGGMGWINMLIFFVSPGLLGAVDVFCIDEPAADDPAGFAAVAARLASTPALPGAGMARTPGAAAIVLETPIERALVSSASRVDFSLIARCLSSSLARIGTRSSGMGLLSLNDFEKLTRSERRLSISLFISACFFFRSRSFSVETKFRKAGTASAGCFAAVPLGAGEGTLLPVGVDAVVALADTAVPSGALTATFGSSDLAGGVVTVPAVLRAPGGTYAFAPRTTAPYLHKV